jgi:hypothetical protein
MAGHYPCDVSRLSAFVAAGLMSIATTAVAGLITTDVVLARSDSMLDSTQ